MKKIITIENLHLFTGCALIIAGVIGYFAEGIPTMLSWTIFGAMYISMSDIGEAHMSDTKKASVNHIVRTMAAYLGATLSVGLLLYYATHVG